MTVTKFNVVPFSNIKTVNCDSNPLNLNKEQLKRLYENICAYFGVGSADQETIKRLYGKDNSI